MTKLKCLVTTIVAVYSFTVNDLEESNSIVDSFTVRKSNTHMQYTKY